MNAQYERQAALVVRVLPDVAVEKCFAIKGKVSSEVIVPSKSNMNFIFDIYLLGL